MEIANVNMAIGWRFSVNKARVSEERATFWQANA